MIAKIYFVRTLAIITALAASSVAVAQTEPAPVPSASPKSATPATPPTAPAPSTTTARAPSEAEVKGYIMPSAAGIRAAQLASAAMHELATTEPFQKRDARRTAELAEQAVRTAYDSMDAMRGFKGLSGTDQSEATHAAKALREARSRVEAMQRQVGVIEGPFLRHEVERIQSELPKLDRELALALTAIERIAAAHTISIALSTPTGTQAPAMGK